LTPDRDFRRGHRCEEIPQATNGSQSAPDLTDFA
jgi:hypothetical protein